MISSSHPAEPMILRGLVERLLPDMLASTTAVRQRVLGLGTTRSEDQQATPSYQ